MGLLHMLAALLRGTADACPHCNRRVSVIAREEPRDDEPETWPVLVCRRHGIVGAVRP